VDHSSTTSITKPRFIINALVSFVNRAARGNAGTKPAPMTHNLRVA